MKANEEKNSKRENRRCRVFLNTFSMESDPKFKYYLDKDCLVEDSRKIDTSDELMIAMIARLKRRLYQVDIY